MLYGMSWLYGITGTTDLVGISQGLMVVEESMRVLLFVVMVLLSAGFAFKIGAVPFHQWAPDAYEGAPTPATAFISVAPKIGGFALILRVMLTMVPRTEFWNMAGDLWVSIAVLTMTIGNLVALWQSNVKRLLAYSSIAQAGYILIGVVAISPRGVAAVLLYLLAYALTNLGAFAAVVAFSNQTGSDEIEDYAGLHKRAPGMALVMLVCLLSLAGIPPTAGFFGKLYLFSAAIEQPSPILSLLAIVGVINSVISLAYYWKVIRAMYFLSSDEEERLPVSLSLNVALGVALAGVLLLTVFLSPLFNLLEVAARTFFG
jgi:NADH-quinone oxidoreductase subunit N